MKLKALFLGLSIVLISLSATAGVYTFAWNPPCDGTNIAGYYLRWGYLSNKFFSNNAYIDTSCEVATPSVYNINGLTNIITTTNTSVTVSNLVSGTTNIFVLSAFNNVWMESPRTYIVFTVPYDYTGGKLPKCSITVESYTTNSYGITPYTFLVVADMFVPSTYRILKNTNLSNTNWTTVMTWSASVPKVIITNAGGNTYFKLSIP